VERDIGGENAVAWLGMANTLATAATAPFSGAVSDLIGRKWVALTGLLFVIWGMLLVGLAQRIEIAIGGTALVGIGAGLAELIASAGVMESVPVHKRGTYVGVLVLLYTPVMGCSAFGTLRSTWFWTLTFQRNYILNIPGVGVHGFQSSSAASTSSSFLSFTIPLLDQIPEVFQSSKFSNESISWVGFYRSVDSLCS
jgi:MFS family permease